MLNRFCAAVAGLCLIATVSTADAGEFDFKDPKGVNAVMAEIESPIEPFYAMGGGLSGTVSFDPAKPEATSGSIALEVASLKVANAMMTEHMHGEKWLNAEKYPSITFAFKKVEKVEAVADNRWKLTVAGELTMHGVTKPVNVEIMASYIKDGVAQRARGEGDLLVLRSVFTVNRHDYGINPSTDGSKIGTDVKLTIAIVGTGK